MVSMRFPSKSLDQKENRHVNTLDKFIHLKGLLISVKAAFDMVHHSQPVQSWHFATDVIQLRQRVVQQNPINHHQNTMWCNQRNTIPFINSENWRQMKECFIVNENL